MSTIAGNTYSSPKGINLKKGLLRFDVTKASNPFSNDSNGYGLYVDSSDNLVYWNGTGTTTVGASGSGSTPTWETIFAADATFTITPDTTLTIAGNRATATDVVTFTNIVGGSGSVIQITNSGSGNDIDGTSNTWGITKAGVITCTGLTLSGANTITSTGGDITWTMEDNDATALIMGSGGATSMIKFDTTNGSEVVVFGNDITLTDGKFTATSTSNTAPLFLLQNDTITTFGNGSTEDQGAFVFSSDTLTTGDLIRLQLDESALVGGAFLKCVQTDAAASVFTIGENGATTIAGSAEGTAALTVTAGDVILTDGALIITAGAFTYTAGDMTMSDGSLAITDADDAATFTVTNNTATSASVVVLTGSGVFTGSTTTSWMTITPSGLTSGTGVYAVFAGLTTGKGVHIATDATQTTGNTLYVQNTGADSAITSGTLASFDLTSTAITSAVNKIGAGVAVTSSRTTTTGTVADDFDLVSFVRTDIINGGGSMSSTGSVVYVENAVTNTSGTVTDTTIGVEVVMDSLGTGDGVSITHAATGAVALDVHGVATSVSDVLITTTGVKANNKASLEVTNSGATAAGGSIFRVTNTGTPAAATSYLVDLDYSGATMTNNPTTVYINGKDSTNSTVEINSSGASAASKGMVSLLNSTTGATGVVVHTQHTSTGSAAADDAVLTVKAEGLDAGDAVTEYGRLEVEIMTATAGQEDGRFIFSTAADDGTLTQMAQISPRAGGALGQVVTGSGAGAGYITSLGAYDLVIDTNEGSSSSNITITDGANGNITLTPNGSGAVNLAGKTLMSETTTSSGAGAVAVTGSIHEITTTGADALTLADGTEGQVLFVVMTVDGGNGTLTPDNLAGGTTITFDAVGDAVTLLFTNSTWFVVGINGAAVA
jgi:hypothetical protein